MLLTRPIPHTEAADLVRGKLPVTRRIFDALQPELKATALVITGVEDLRAIERVRNITAGIPEGGDWDEAKNRILAELAPWIDDEEAAERRAELLLRSHAYAAYATANYRALEEQSDIFTWRKYQTAQDERVRGTHAALDGLIAPSSSPFWRDHTPPWDFGCRCDIVGLTDDDVEELRQTGSQILTEDGKPGIKIIEPGTDELTALEQGNLFRDQTMHFVARDPDHYIFDPEAPLINIAMLEGMKKRVGPRAWAAFQDWARDAEVPGVGPVWDWMTRKPRKRTPKKTTAITAAQARAQLATFTARFTAADAEIDQIIASKWSSARSLYDQNPDYRSSVPGLAEAYARRDEVIAEARKGVMLDPAAKRPFDPTTTAKKDKKILVARNKEALDLWAKMVGPANLETLNQRKALLLIRNPGSRAYYDLRGGVNMTPGNSVSVHMHEIAHWMEDTSPDLFQRSIDFLERRTAGDPISYYNGSFSEPAKADKFWSLYCGRQYRKGAGAGDFYATEILSMGIERFTFDPIAFAADDPDYFDFIFDTLRKPL